MHYLNTTFDILGKSFLEKGKYLLLVLFACKEPSLFHISSKRGKREENLFNLVALESYFQIARSNLHIVLRQCLFVSPFYIYVYM